MKKIEIGNRTFELNKKAKDVFARYSNLDDAYKKASTTKARIFNAWDRWACEVKANGFGIHSKTQQFFTLCGTVGNEGKTYRFLITPNHNYAWEV